MLCLILAIGATIAFGYKLGQTDALHGEWKYEIVNTTEIKAKG